MDMASGKATVVAKTNTDQLWKNKENVYVSTIKGDLDSTESSTVKKYNTKTKKFVKDTLVKKPVFILQMNRL